MIQNRSINLNLLLKSSTRSAPKKALARVAKIRDFELSRMLNGTGPPPSDAILGMAASLVGLDKVPGYSSSRFDDSPLKFEAFLRSARFGKFEGENDPVWLDDAPQCRCIFFPQQLVAALTTTYRDSFGRTAPPDPELADTEGRLGERYGVLCPLQAEMRGMLEEVRAGRTAALLLHRDRVSESVELIVTDPYTRRGTIHIVQALAPSAPDPEEEILDGASNDQYPTYCLLSGDGGGYQIGGHPGRRDVNVYLCVRDAVPASLLQRPSGPIDARALLEVRSAVLSAIEQQQVLAMRFVYDAL